MHLVPPGGPAADHAKTAYTRLTSGRRKYGLFGLQTEIEIDAQRVEDGAGLILSGLDSRLRRSGRAG